jgi:hypothetical protein
MSKKIQAYFQTENDAWAANIQIQTYGAEYLEMSELPEPLGADTRLLIPFAAGMPSSGASGNMLGYSSGAPGTTETSGRAAATYVAVQETEAAVGADNRSLRADEAENEEYAGGRPHLRYVLAATVEDGVCPAIVEAIRHSGGYVEVFD